MKRHASHEAGECREQVKHALSRNMMLIKPHSYNYQCLDEKLVMTCPSALCDKADLKTMGTTFLDPFFRNKLVIFLASLHILFILRTLSSLYTFSTGL